MDEHEFDSWPGLRPFQSQDVKQFERVMALAAALWGTGLGHIERQLRAPHPEIPAGFDLADFRILQRQSEMILIALQRKPLGPQWGSFRSMMDKKILVGSQTFTLAEACCEIVRRAIDFLENDGNLK